MIAGFQQGFFHISFSFFPFISDGIFEPRVFFSNMYYQHQIQYSLDQSFPWELPASSFSFLCCMHFLVQFCSTSATATTTKPNHLGEYLSSPPFSSEFVAGAR